ncbi:MAG: hypothetical protein AB2A00_02205, partial [Myxococcota bacterium]
PSPRPAPASSMSSSPPPATPPASAPAAPSGGMRTITAVDPTGGVEQPYAPVDPGMADARVAQARALKLRRNLAEEVRGRARTALVLGALGGFSTLLTVGAGYVAFLTAGAALSSALAFWYSRAVLSGPDAGRLQAREQWLLVNVFSLPVALGFVALSMVSLALSGGAGLFAVASLLRREVLLIENQAALANPE